MEWMINNIGTILISVALAAVLVLIAVKLIKDKRNGKSSCGGNCAHCAMGGSCHKH